MNVALDALKTRRSIRRYKPEMPEREDLDKIIEAGLYAASGRGWQSSIIVAVTNKELRDRLMEMNRIIWEKEPGVDPFFGAPVVLIVLAKKGRFTVQDGSLTMANLMQAAHALGLGSCWINRAKEEFETEEGKAILRELGIEGDWEGVGHCIIGYIDGEEPVAAPRKDGRVYWVE